MKKGRPGQKITIKINGKPVETFIDEEGTQRFRNNKIIGYVLRCDKKFFSFEKMWNMANAGLFDSNDLRLIYQNNGYDMCGYEELFPDDKIENPLDK